MGEKADRRRRRNYLWETPNYSSNDNDATSTDADTSADEAVGGGGTQPLRSMNMNAYPPQNAPRQAPRLQNTQKTALGNGAGAGWGGFNMTGSGGGFGGLGGSAQGLGQGQGRPGQLSGFAQVMGGGGQQGPIDMSEFPSLSGGQRSQQNSANAAGWNSTAIRQPAGQQNQPPQTQQRTPSAAPSQQSLDQFDGPRSQQSSMDRGGGGDEFPPLAGQMNGDAIEQAATFNGTLGSPEMQPPRMNGQQTQLPIREASSGHQQAQHPSIAQPSTQPQLQTAQNGQPLSPPGLSSVKKYADMSENEKWGLPGLIAAIEARRQSELGGQVDDTLPTNLKSAVLFGQDLNALGMDFESPEPLYPTFTPFPIVSNSRSEFDFHDRHIVPDFSLPSAYTVNNVPPLSSRMSAFSDETLFSIFYQHPRDILQELAAQELVTRDWRWHKVLRQWLQKDSRESQTGSSLPLVDMTNGTPVGTTPLRTGERTERGVYVFFDALGWKRERKQFELDYDELDNSRVAAIPNGAGPVGPAPLAVGMGPQSGVGSSGIPSA